MAKSYDEFYEEEEKKLEESKKKQQDVINETHDNRAKIVNDQYDMAVENTRLGYESDYERNAVQKYINEKQIAERNASLGLTDSGLNRTQQTATQLSYANQKGDIDLAKRKALDTLSQNLAATMAEIEQSRTASLAELEASYDAQAQSNAANRYNAAISAEAKNSSGGSGGSSGKVVNTAYYQGDLNSDVVIYGAFGNGYQPKGISGHGKLKDSGDTITFNTQTLYGQNQTVTQIIWIAEDGTKWYWEGRQNKYLPIQE